MCWNPSTGRTANRCPFASRGCPEHRVGRIPWQHLDSSRKCVITDGNGCATCCKAIAPALWAPSFGENHDSDGEWVPPESQPQAWGSQFWVHMLTPPLNCLATPVKYLNSTASIKWERITAPISQGFYGECSSGSVKDS